MGVSFACFDRREDLRLTEKGVEFTWGSLHDGFGGFDGFLAVLENTLPSFCWSYKMQDKEATVTVLTVLAVLAVMAILVVTVTPLKLNPPPPFFRHPEDHRP